MHGSRDLSVWERSAKDEEGARAASRENSSRLKRSQSRRQLPAVVGHAGGVGDHKVERDESVELESVQSGSIVACSVDVDASAGWEAMSIVDRIRSPEGEDMLPS